MTMLFRVKRYRTSTGDTRESSRIQCMRVYPDEILPSGQPRRQVVATIDRWAKTLPPQVRKILTQDEQDLWRQWKTKHDAKHQATMAAHALAEVPRILAASALAINDGHTPPADLWQAIDLITAALRAAGHTQPKRPRGRPRKVAEGNRSGINHGKSSMTRPTIDLKP